MNAVKACLAVLLGVVIGISVMTLIRPQPVKAQQGVFVTSWHEHAPTPVNIQGSRVVGISCIPEQIKSMGAVCFIASQ